MYIYIFVHIYAYVLTLSTYGYCATNIVRITKDILFGYIYIVIVYIYAYIVNIYTLYT